jgi:hypothetical protein
MSVETDELVAVAERLSPQKRAAVADFARFLLSREAAEEDGDAAWERIIADPHPRPKLEAFLKASAAEGSEPMDLDKLKP